MTGELSPEEPAKREADLVAAWRSGDASAFSEIVRIHRRRLFAVALHQTGNAESAEDAVQVALHKAHRAVGRLEGGNDVAGWLTSIVVNAARDESRRDVRHRRIAASATDVGEGAEAPAVAARNAGEESGRLERLELGKTLHDAISALPDPYRRPVELFHVQGLSVGDVAKALSLNPNTVKTHLARGRAILQRMLERRLREGGWL
jgi:RNA polymerase sigma-70 factor (ECF subfamily)